jgi:O-antigen/teichoic acid export membrane protein
MKETFRAIFKLGSWTLFSIAMGAFMMKIVATVMGPAGVGILSLLRQTQQTFVSLATVNGDTALVQGLSSLSGRDREDYLATVGKIFLITVLITSIVFFFLSPMLGPLIFPKEDLGSIQLVRWILLPAFFSCISVFVLGVLNSYRATGKMAFSQGIAALAGALVAYPLSINGQYGALIILLSVVSITSFIASFFFAVRSGWMKPLFVDFWRSMQQDHVRHFFSISGVAVMVGFAGTGTLLLVRLSISHYFGIASAGIFDVAWTLSSMYLVLFLSTFGTHFLPEMSREPDADTLKLKIFELMHFSILISIAMIVFVIVLKPFIVNALYSDKFISALDIIRWMLVGDYFKVTGWVLSIPMLARSYMRPYFILSISWNLLFSLAAIVLFLFIGDIEYMGAAYLFTQVVYVTLSFWYWKKCHNLNFSNKLTMLWLFGLCVVVSASIVHWNSSHISILAVVGWGLVVVFFIWCGLGLRGRSALKETVVGRFCG